MTRGVIWLTGLLAALFYVSQATPLPAESVEEVKPQVVANFVDDALSKFKEVIKNKFTQYNDSIGELETKVKETFENLGDKARLKFKEVKKNVMQDIQDGKIKLEEGLDYLKKEQKRISEELKKNLDDATEYFKNKIEEIMKNLKETSEKIKQNVKNMIDKIRKIKGNQQYGFMDGISKWVNIPGNMIKDLEKISREKVLPRGKKITDTMVDETMEGIRDFFDEMNRIGEDARKQFENGWNEINPKTAGILDNITDSIGNWFGKIQNGSFKILDAALNNFNILLNKIADQTEYYLQTTQTFVVKLSEKIKTVLDDFEKQSNEEIENFAKLNENDQVLEENKEKVA